MPQQFSDNNIDKAFREKLGGLRVEPRSRVWYRVSAGLDREAALVAHKKRRVIGVLIGVVLLTGIVLTAVLDPVATRKKISNTSGNIPQIIGAISKKHLHSSELINTEIFNSVIKTNSKESVLNSNVSYSQLLEANIAGSDIVVKPISEIKEINNIKGFLFQLEEYKENNKTLINEDRVFAIDKFVSDVTVNEIENCNCQDKFYVGANFKLNRTSFSDTSLRQNLNFVDKFHIQKAISVFAGYNITKNISAELGWNILSNEGQSYGYTSLSRKPGTKATRKDYEIALRYTQIPIKIRYGVECWSGILKTHVTYSLAIGAMYGKLLRSGFTTSDMDISSRLKKSEIAGIGNASIDIKLFKKFSFSTGIEASYSNNIFLKDNRISPFTAPHNFVVGATAGVKYNFCGK